MDSLSGSSFQADIEESSFKLRLNQTTKIQKDTINKCKPNQNDGISLLYIVRNRFSVLVDMQKHRTRQKQNIVRSTCNFLVAVTFLQLHDVWKAVTIRILVLFKMSLYFYGPFGLRTLMFFQPFTEHLIQHMYFWVERLAFHGDLVDHPDGLPPIACPFQTFEYISSMYGVSYRWAVDNLDFFSSSLPSLEHCPLSGSWKMGEKPFA